MTQRTCRPFLLVTAYYLILAAMMASTSSSYAFHSPAAGMLRQRRRPLLAPYPADSSKMERTAGSPPSRLHAGIVEAWDAYDQALEANPLIVKSITAGIILGAADLAGQAFERGQKKRADEANEPGSSSAEGAEIDWARVGRFAIFGLVLQAPWNHFYYLLLDNKIPPTEQPFSPTNTVKIFIDQFVQAPVFTVLIFVFLGLLEGKGTEAIQRQLKNDYKETIFANWKLWVPATVINIGFVPPIFRVLYLNGVFFFWSIYLSLVINKAEEE